MGKLSSTLDPRSFALENKRWDTYILALKNNPTYYSIRTIEQADITPYIGDAYGCMINVLHLDMESLYPNMLLNDMVTPTDFGYKHMNFKILNADIFNKLMPIVSKNY